MLNYTKDLSFTFNEKANPKVNTLYIHLLNGQYYSDDIFCKKKIEIEREILFLLAAKLGVHMIEYDVETTEVTVSNITASTDIKNVNIHFSIHLHYLQQFEEWSAFLYPQYIPPNTLRDHSWY